MTLRLATLMGILCAGPALADKSNMYDTIRRQEDELWRSALKIWEWAEPGYQETQSAKLLADMLKRAGFEVESGVAGIPTAFIATYGNQSPVIGILGEYDALPGLSQSAEPVRQPRREATYGHGCGHHLFGVASVAASIAISERIKSGELQGSVRFYGCPAEEGGAAKVFMVLDKRFDDCGAVLHWHPAAQNLAGDRSSLARMAVKFRFHGKSAHAAAAPDQGRSALDAVELTNHATQLLREHTPDRTRIHHVVTVGGAAPNVVPDYAEVYYYVRHPKSGIVRDLYRRVVLCAQGAALATETKLEIEFEGGIVELLSNNTLAQVTLKNLRELNDLEWTDDDRRFALKLQESLDKPLPLDSVKVVQDRSGSVGMGSTDVGDVSWTVPTTGFSTACWVPGTPGHSWQAVASGGTPIARRGMLLAARVMAATGWDLLSQPALLQQARGELCERLNGDGYRTLMEPGQQPPLNYRRRMR